MKRIAKIQCEMFEDFRVKTRGNVGVRLGGEKYIASINTIWMKPEALADIIDSGREAGITVQLSKTLWLKISLEPGRDIKAYFDDEK